MAWNPTFDRNAGGGRQPVAWGAQRPRAASSVGILLACTGHAGTFLALAAGGLWLGLHGPEAYPPVRGLLAGGLHLQLLPALGFVMLARDRLRDGRVPASLAAVGLSAVSFGLMGVGLLQMAWRPGAVSVLLAVATATAAAVGFGIVAGGVARLVRERFESEPLIILDPEPGSRPG